MPQLPSPELLSAVPALLAVIEERSATRAAKRLGTTPATVLRRIDALEVELGVRLFNRLPTGLEPTEALARVQPWFDHVAGAVASMHRAVSGLEEGMAGTVRVAMPTAVAREFFLDELPSFRARYPDIVLEFASAVAVVDLPGRDADLALRTLRPTQPSLVARKLHSFRYVLACAPALLEGRASIDLGLLAWIHWDGHAAHIAEARWLDQHLPEAKVVMRAADMSTILDAAQRGIGAIVVAEPLACVAGGLVEIPTGLPLLQGETWLVAHEAMRHVPRVAAVWSWIEERFGAVDARALPAWRCAGDDGSGARGPLLAT